MLKKLDGRKVLLWGVISWLAAIVLLVIFGGGSPPTQRKRTGLSSARVIQASWQSTGTPLLSSAPYGSTSSRTHR
jgi:hypothetical protein